MRKIWALVVIPITAFLIIISIVIASIYIDRTLSFEKIYQKEYNYDPQRLDMWYTIIDGKPESEFVTDNVEDLGIDKSIFDFQKYNYIIAFNHEIKKITYNYLKANMRNKMLIPTSIIGQATLDKDVTNYIYVYRFRKINISSDWHDYSDDYE